MRDIEVLELAWYVFHNDMIGENAGQFKQVEDIPPVFADNKEKALLEFENSLSFNFSKSIFVTKFLIPIIQ